MTLIQKAVRKKITAADIEKQKLAKKKCIEADNLLKKADNDKELILEAIDLYSEAVEINPDEVEPYIAIAYLCSITGDYESAVRLINRACKLEPFNIYLEKMKTELMDKYKNGIMAQKVSEISRKSLEKSDKTRPIKNNYANLETIEEVKKAGNS